jgi:hypothetical protein
MDDLIGKLVHVTVGPLAGETGTVVGQIRDCCKIDIGHGPAYLYLFAGDFEVIG